MDKQQTTSEKILERIASGNVAPRPRLFFMLKNVGLWALAGVSMLVGGLAVSSILFRAINLPRVLPPGAPLPSFAVFLYLVPVLWILLFGAFGYLAYREVRSTKKGYRYELSTLLLSLALVSTLLGLVFYATGTGIFLDRFAARHIPFQKDLEGIQRERWLKPEHGFLVGTVEATTASGIVLRDPGDLEWQVTFAESIPDGKKEGLAEGERVGLRGAVTSDLDHAFLACDIRSLEFEGAPKAAGLPPPHAMMRVIIVEERNPGEPRSTDCGDVRPLDQN